MTEEIHGVPLAALPPDGSEDAPVAPLATIPGPSPLIAMEVHDVQGDSVVERKEERELRAVRDELGIDELMDPLKALLEAPGGTPQDTWFCGRLKSKFVIQGLDNPTYEKIQDQSIRLERNQQGRIEKALDASKLSRLIVAHGCMAPNWNDPSLAGKYGRQFPEQIVGRALLPGEIEACAEKILKLTGFQSELEELGKG